MNQVLEKLNGNKYIGNILSFLLPLLLFGLILAQFGIYPFGSKSILINDLYSQYVQFYNRLYDVFFDGKSLFYSWEAGLGLNFTGVIAYYLSSPLSLFILFFERNHLPEAIVLITIVKIGLSGTTMYLFLNQFKVNDRMQLLIFSTLYALMTFSVAYSFNLMWLDGIYMLPLILIGVEFLIKRGRFSFFLINLAITFIANFYISYMVGIFTFFYFLVRYFSIHDKAPISLFVKRFFLFGMSTAIAAGLSAFLILPTYIALKTNAVESATPKPLPGIHMFDLYAKFFNSSFDSLVDGLPNIYVGLLPLLLFPLFFISQKIKLKEKVCFLLFTLLIYFSFQNSQLNFLWHGMDNPNWFPFRYSFLLSFLTIFLGFRVFLVLEKNVWPYVKGLYLFNVFFILLFTKLTPDVISNKVVFVNIVILTLYVILLYFKLHPLGHKGWIHVLIIIVVCFDVSYNSASIIRGLDSQFQYQSREAYKGSSDYQRMISWIQKKDPSFYRMDSRNSLTWNDSMQLQYKKMDSFNSLSNNDMNHFLNVLGYSTMESVFIAMNGGIITTDSLLGFKYIVSSNPIKKHGYEIKHRIGNLQLYENKNVLPLGFVLNNQKSIDFVEKFDNPFQKQNELFKGTSTKNAASNLFKPLESKYIQYENLSVVKEEDGQRLIKKDKTKSAFITFSFPVWKKQQLYSLFKLEGISNTNVYVNDHLMRKNYPTPHDNRVLDLGSFQNETALVKIEVLTDELKVFDFLFYALDINLFEDRINELKSQSLKIENFSDTGVKGNIKLNSESVLFMSIPYDEGWKATVDGKETETVKLGGFLGVELDEGNHRVELQYVPPGFRTGSIISICSLFLFLGLAFFNKGKS